MCPLCTGVTFSLTLLLRRLSDRLRLSEMLDDEAMEILVSNGLATRLQEQCAQWRHESNAVRNVFRSRAEADITAAMKALSTGLPGLKRSLFEAALDRVVKLYP